MFPVWFFITLIKFCLLFINLMFHRLPSTGYPSSASSPPPSTPLCFNESVVLTSSDWFGAEPLLFCTAWTWRSQKQRGYQTHTHTHTREFQSNKEINTELLNIIFHFTCSSLTDSGWPPTEPLVFVFPFFFPCVPWSCGHSAAVWPSMCDAVGNKRALSLRQKTRTHTRASTIAPCFSHCSTSEWKKSLFPKPDKEKKVDNNTESTVTHIQNLAFQLFLKAKKKGLLAFLWRWEQQKTANKRSKNPSEEHQEIVSGLLNQQLHQRFR